MMHCVFFLGEYLELPWAKQWTVSVEYQNASPLFLKGQEDFVDAANWSSLLIRFPDLIDRAKTILRTLHYTYSTEKTYLEWICRFLNFSKLKSLDELSDSDIREYLEYLATNREVSSSTQRQALNAIVFLFKKVLEKPLGDIGPYEKSKRPKRLPVVLTKNEVEKTLNEMTGIYSLMAGLLYGSGLRLMECLRLRVKDVDFEQQQIVVRDGKGSKDRVTIMPVKYKESLREHVKDIKKQHERDLEQGYGTVYLWPSLERKYPHIAKEWGWQYVFPAKKMSVDPRSGQIRRHHIHEASLQKAFKKAIRATYITKQNSCHTLRHFCNSFT